MNIVRKITRIIRRDGFKWFLIRLVARLLNQKLEIQRAKDKAWHILSEKYHSKVAYGPFKGMQLSDDVWWSANDRITQTLGIYEAHVMNELVDFSKNGARRFVDLGAADGYFAVGMAYGGIYDEVFAFEISEKAREQISKNAARNDCLEKIQIHGEATANGIRATLGDGVKASVLIDIEGFEYTLLDDEMLNELRDHFVIIELHPWMVEGGNILERNLIERASETFDARLIQRDCYDPNRFEELAGLSDEERLIAVGEGRGRNMKWLVLSPKSDARSDQA